MKLRKKMSLAFGILVIAIILAIGGVAYSKSVAMGVSDAKNTMKIAAGVASSEIQEKLSDFVKITQMAGMDVTLATESNDVKIAAYIDNLAEGYGFTSGNILNKSGISRKDGTDFSDREYVKRALAGEVNISELTVSKYTGQYGFSVASPIHSGDKINGVVYFRMDVDFVDAILQKISVSENSYTFLVDGEGLIIVHPDESLIGNLYINDPENGLGVVADEILSGECGSGEFTVDGVKYLCGYSPISGTDGWNIVVAAPQNDFMAVVYDTVKSLLFMDIIAIIIALLVAGLFARTITYSIVKVSEQLSAIAEGNLSTNIEATKRKDEVGKLQNAAHDLQTTFQNMIGETNDILGSMADYDLTKSNMNSYPGEFNQISVSVNRIKGILNHLIRDVQESASSVGMGSGELADAADALAAGTVTQASSINQLVSNMEDMTERISRNSENEERVEARLEELDNLIQNGNAKMGQLREVVKEIEDMSSDIKNIVGTIDTIAFQINILALNASVEAARAGESGRGFAVVADEVGSLAEKTSASSKMTAELIANCLKQIERAMECAESTAGCLKDIVDNSEVISDAFKDISVDTKEQAEKSLHIKVEIANISDVVQTNTATAEETAAATQELSEQAKSLSKLISKFRV